MKQRYNLKSIIAGLIVLLIGISLVLIDVFITKTDMNLYISIGCSLIASALVILLNDLFVDVVKMNYLDEWKINKIYATRAEKNADSDPNLDKAEYRVDVVAFGLRSFRQKYHKKVELCLKKGVNFRIITMNPESKYINDREKEEGDAKGNIQISIYDLIKWANELNDNNYKGKIIIKGYNCMTLDFYWRVDDDLYVGPYWYGCKSSDTITYRYQKEGKGFSLYTEYFDRLWNNDTLMIPLTTVTEFTIKKKRKAHKLH